MYYINPKCSLELNLMESHNSHFESIICPRFQVLQKNPKSMMLRIRKERGKKKEKKEKSHTFKLKQARPSLGQVQ